MAVVYVDPVSGNDTTGDGSYGNPWKTIDKGTTSRSAGDEVRVAYTAITALDGTLTFTDGSTSVATSADLTAVVAAGDLISKNANHEGWWLVASVGAASITLARAYYGRSGSGSAVTGYKVTPIAVTEEADIASSGAAGNLLLISGGWDLSSQTQVGYTALSSTYGNGIDAGLRSYFKLEKFILYSSGALSYTINLGTANVGIEVSDVFIYSAGYHGIYGAGFSHKFTDVSIVGGAGIYNSFYIGHLCELLRCYSFACGTGGSNSAYNLIGAGNLVIDCEAIYPYFAGISFATSEFGNNFIDNFVITGHVTASADAILISGNNNKLSNVTVTGTFRYIVAQAGPAFGNFLSGSFDAPSTAVASNNLTYESLAPYITVVEDSDDAVSYHSTGTVTHDSSAAARSGKALKFTPSHASVGPIQSVGLFKVSSAASDVSVKFYIKDDVAFNGTVLAFVSVDEAFVSKTVVTTTTDWAQQSIVVAAADLTANKFIEIQILVYGTAGNVWIDDVSAEQ